MSVERLSKVDAWHYLGIILDEHAHIAALSGPHGCLWLALAVLTTLKLTLFPNNKAMVSQIRIILVVHPVTSVDLVPPIHASIVRLRLSKSTHAAPAPGTGRRQSQILNDTLIRPKCIHAKEPIQVLVATRRLLVARLLVQQSFVHIIVSVFNVCSNFFLL